MSLSNMNRREVIILCTTNLVSALLISPRAHSQTLGKTYHVASSGSDSNDGLTPQTAWQTIARVVSTSHSFQPGDNISFKGGESFEGSLTTANNGTAIQPIRFTSYGLGKARIINPTNKPAIYLNSNCHLIFQGLEVSSIKGRGVLLSETKNGSNDILFDNLDIRNCGLEGFCCSNVKDFRITLKDSTIEKTLDEAVEFNGDSITLKGNRIRGNGLKPAVLIYGAQKVVFEDNEVSTDVAPKPIFYEMDRKPAFYIADRNIWRLPRTMYEGFRVGKRDMSLSELRRLTGQHANDNRPLVMNPTPQLPQVQPQSQPNYQTPQGLVDPRTQPGWNTMNRFVQWSVWSRYTNALEQLKGKR